MLGGPILVDPLFLLITYLLIFALSEVWGKHQWRLGVKDGSKAAMDAFDDKFKKQIPVFEIQGAMKLISTLQREGLVVVEEDIIRGANGDIKIEFNELFEKFSSKRI